MRIFRRRHSIFEGYSPMGQVKGLVALFLLLVIALAFYHFFEQFPINSIEFKKKRKLVVTNCPNHSKLFRKTNKLDRIIEILNNNSAIGLFSYYEIKEEFENTNTLELIPGEVWNYDRNSGVILRTGDGPAPMYQINEFQKFNQLCRGDQ